MIDLHSVALSAVGFVPDNIEAQIDGTESFLRSFACKSPKTRHVAARVFLILSLLASRSLAAIAVVAVVASRMDKCCLACRLQNSGHATALGARGACIDLVGVLVLDPGERLEKSGSCSSPARACARGTR